jgi:phosphoribosyl-AMP cyclohydrolase
MNNNLEQSLQAQLDFGPDGSKLLPVVTQDSHSKEVLIVSFVNAMALERTRSSGYACYWSRSRNCLWEKGASSGNRLKIDEIRINCEQNSLLFLVSPEQDGACHALRRDGKAHTSCYYRRLNCDNSLSLLEE